MIETLAYGYSYESTQQDLSNEYHHGRVKIVFKNIFVLVLLTKVASALKGLKLLLYVFPPCMTPCFPNSPMSMLHHGLCLTAAKGWTKETDAALQVHRRRPVQAAELRLLRESGVPQPRVHPGHQPVLRRTHQATLPPISQPLVNTGKCSAKLIKLPSLRYLNL